MGLRVPTTCVGHSNGKQRLGLAAPNSTHTQSGLLGMICSKNLDFVTTTSLVLQCLFKILIPFSNLRLSHGWRCEELNDVMALEVTLTIGHPAGKSCTRQGAWKGFSGFFFSLALKNSSDLVRNQTARIYSCMYRWDMKRQANYNLLHSH